MSDTRRLWAALQALVLVAGDEVSGVIQRLESHTHLDARDRTALKTLRQAVISAQSILDQEKACEPVPPELLEAARAVVNECGRDMPPSNGSVERLRRAVARSSIPVRAAPEGEGAMSTQEADEELQTLDALAAHGIPYYAYGDNEAAVAMAHRLADVAKVVARLREMSRASAPQPERDPA